MEAKQIAKNIKLDHRIESLAKTPAVMSCNKPFKKRVGKSQ